MPVIPALWETGPRGLWGHRSPLLPSCWTDLRIFTGFPPLSHLTSQGWSSSSSGAQLCPNFLNLCLQSLKTPTPRVTLSPCLPQRVLILCFPSIALVIIYPVHPCCLPADPTQMHMPQTPHPGLCMLPCSAHVGTTSLSWGISWRSSPCGGLPWLPTLSSKGRSHPRYFPKTQAKYEDGADVSCAWDAMGRVPRCSTHGPGHRLNIASAEETKLTCADLW